MSTYSSFDTFKNSELYRSNDVGIDKRSQWDIKLFVDKQINWDIDTIRKNLTSMQIILTQKDTQIHYLKQQLELAHENNRKKNEGLKNMESKLAQVLQSSNSVLDRYQEKKVYTESSTLTSPEKLGIEDENHIALMNMGSEFHRGSV